MMNSFSHHTFCELPMIQNFCSIREKTMGQSALSFRICTLHQTLPTFMAQYGNQHNSPFSHLEKFGFLGHYEAESVEWPAQARHFHPIEVGLLHGPIDSLYVPQDKALGGKIIPQHASLIMLSIDNQFQGRTIDDTWQTELPTQHFQNTRLSNLGLKIHSVPNGHLVTSSMVITTKDCLGNLIALDELPQMDKFWVPTEGVITDVDVPMTAAADHQVQLAQTFSPKSNYAETIEVPSSPMQQDLPSPTEPVSFLHEVQFQLAQAPHRFKFDSTLLHQVFRSRKHHQS